MNLDSAFDPSRLVCLHGIHVVFVVSALILALSDRCTSHGE